MLRLRLIGPGRFKKDWQREAFLDYQKRLGRFCQLNLIEVNDSPDQLPFERALQLEAQDIRRYLQPGQPFWLLDLGGVMPDSEDLARRLARGFELGASQLTVVHGGSRGVDPALRAEAQFRLSLSPLTFTHLMSRVLFVEQLFRAAKMWAHEPYHK